MKKISYFLFATFLFVAMSCGEDKCIKCEQSVLGIGVSQEACEDGSDLKVTVVAFGITQDTVIKNKTLAAFETESKADGYTCK